MSRWDGTGRGGGVPGRWSGAVPTRCGCPSLSRCLGQPLGAPGVPALSPGPSLGRSADPAGAGEDGGAHRGTPRRRAYGGAPGLPAGTRCHAGIEPSPGGVASAVSAPRAAPAGRGGGSSRSSRGDGGASPVPSLLVGFSLPPTAAGATAARPGPGWGWRRPKAAGTAPRFPAQGAKPAAVLDGLTVLLRFQWTAGSPDGGGGSGQAVPVLGCLPRCRRPPGCCPSSAG